MPGQRRRIISNVPKTDSARTSFEAWQLIVSACPCACLPIEFAPSCEVSLSASANFLSCILRSAPTHCTSRYSMVFARVRTLVGSVGRNSSSRTSLYFGCFSLRSGESTVSSSK
eukprot:470141-Prymnesium_polylepis.1